MPTNFAPALAYQLINYANEAYQIYNPDSFFAAGYTTLNGSFRQYGSRADWLSKNDYTVIEDPKVTEPHVRYWGIVAETTDAVIVAFRGTDFTKLNDIRIDAWGGFPTPQGKVGFPMQAWNVADTGPSQTVSVHRGFIGQYLELQASVRKLVQARFTANPSLNQLYVTGHSLGGALATLCVADLGTNGSALSVPAPSLYSFAAPYAGDQKFVDVFTAGVPDPNAVYLTNDPVSGVPNVGWTPAWMEWYDGGKVGPAPTPEFTDFVTVPGGQPLTSPYYYPASHSLSVYYSALGAIQPSKVNKSFNSGDPVTSLELEVYTANTLGSGTDADVYAGLMGVAWGPLDLPGNDFERGSVGTYDLFKMFPSQKPANPIVADITQLCMWITNAGYFDVYDYPWQPGWAIVKVNGKQFVKCTFNEWCNSLDRPVCRRIG